MSAPLNHPSWETAPSRLSLAADEVHVWRVSLEQPESRLQSLAAVLAPLELERSQRYVFKRDRDRFIVARGLLRNLLGRYLDRAPAQLKFSYSQYGKPFLEESADVRFNLSHSGSLALYAVTKGRELGIDVEHIRRDVDVGGIAQRFFSSDEAAVLDGVASERRVEAFFNCWTRKEAYIKARGEGIHFGLDNFDVSLVPGEDAALLRVIGQDSEPSRWSFQALYPHPDYAAALAAEGNTWRVKCWEYTE